MPGGDLPISVVVTVRDDRDALAALLPALDVQTRPLDELVVVDAGSTDGTVELLESWQARLPLRVIVEPGANISRGRNVGIRAARSDWIACTDAGCSPAPGWLEALAGARERAAFVSGIYMIDARTPFEEALAAALYPSPEEIGDESPAVRLSHRLFGRSYDPRRATGRSMAFTKEAWEAAGGFREDLYAGEDVGFSTAVAEAGFEPVLEPDARVGWRPRPTWEANARMFRYYARGEVRSLSPRRHLLRLLVYGSAPLLALGGGRATRLLLLVAAAAYVGLPLERARRLGLPVRDWWRIPALIAMKDLCQLAGAGEGMLDELRGRAQPAPGRGPAPPRTPSR